MVPGYQVPGTRYQVPGTRYQVPGTRYQEPPVNLLRVGLYGPSVRILTADYANECTHSFARLLGHLALAIAVGRAGDFLAFSLCEKIFLRFSQLSPIFSRLLPMRENSSPFLTFSLYVRKSFSSSPYVEKFFLT